MKGYKRSDIHYYTMSNKENLDEKQKPSVQKSMLLKPYQAEWIDKTGRNFSLFIRQKIKEQMAREGFDPHTGENQRDDEIEIEK
jgi:hypothetical protein